MKIETVNEFIELVEVLTVTWNCPVDAHGCETLPPSSVQAKNNERIGETFRKAKKLVVGYLSEQEIKDDTNNKRN